MSQLSRLLDSPGFLEVAETEPVCICCGRKPKYGGYFYGPQSIAVCSVCVRNGSGMDAIGYALGDAIVDLYVAPHVPLTERNVTDSINKVLKAIERKMYYSVAIGFEKYMQKRLREERE